MEFAECVESESLQYFTVGKIYRVSPNNQGVDKTGFLIDNKNEANGFWGSNRKHFKPSTESAYVAQLKKEAFERFGEIKEGDRFKTGSMFESPTVVKFFDQQPKFQYFKDYDQLFHYNVEIYRQGKWATKLPKRIEVKYIYHDYDQGNYYADRFALGFESKNLGERDYDKIGQFLAFQLETYLNKE